MSLSIKHRSGGEILAAAFEQHCTMADVYRERYASVPVKVRKHRPMTISMLLGIRLLQLKAQRLVRERAERREVFGNLYGD